MVGDEIMRSLAMKTPSKIVLVVLDGLGGLRIEGKTELEAAHTPHLDELASRSICGVADPVSPGITPGSGPAHLGMLGYEPLRYEIGRGVLEALGIGMELGKSDVVARGNFATMDQKGIIVDRRAGRIPTEKNKELCALLQEEIKEIEDARVEIRSGKEHRFVLRFIGQGLDGRLEDTDPQKEGNKPRQPTPLAPEAEKTARIVKDFLKRANQVLQDHHPANTVLLRGISRIPAIPSMSDLFKLTPACIATYPMYKGLARLVGMEILETGEGIADEFKTLKENYKRFDYFFLHVKKTDSYGEDGNFEKKVEVIEEVDRHIPVLVELAPDVIAVTGDHSTPALLKGHSWHPNPFILCSRYERIDDVKEFAEAACAKGGLGRFLAVHEMPLMLAAALKLTKFGA
ncbi:MAG: phosphoglycerate mutase [Deltaproteobacteria bacterium RBG_16_54_11]|jgi:2,3-bisphosphoglycerate-independent phosphoglycerate mutase|nr:MAG: phosphoglycerate mutase [Deltaproteobacteria bacterium RBG_16_54_11]